MSRDIAHKAVKNFFFNGGRLVITMGATLCTSAIIARTLGPANMGIYGYAMWIVGTLGILAGLGLPNALTKYLAEYLGSGDIATAKQVGKKLLIVQLAVAVGVAVLTACFMLVKSPYRTVIGIAAIMLFAQALQQSLNGALAGLQRFDRLTRISLYVALVSVASVAVAGLLHAGVAGMLWATFVGLAVTIWLYYRDVDRFLLKLPQPAEAVAPAVDPFKRIRNFSLTVSYILLVDAIVWQRSEILFLKHYSMVVAIGFYTIAYSMSSKLTDITSTFSTTLMPLYSESYGRSGLQDVGKVFTNALKYLQMLMVPLCFLAVALARPVVQILYGSRFLAVAPPLQLLIACVPITSIGVVVSPLLYGVDRQSFIARYGTVVAVLNVVLDVILIRKYAALGAAEANCAAQIAGVFGGTLYTLRHIQVRFPWKTTLKIYGAAAIAVAPVAYVVALTSWGVSGIVGATVVGALLYLGSLVIVGELGKRDIQVVRTAFLKKVYAPKALEAVDTV